LAELSGHTARVYSLISTLHLLNTSSYPVNERPPQLELDEPFYDMSRVSGRVLEGVRKIELKGVPIVAPAGGSAGAARGGEELVKSLDVSIAVCRPLLSTGCPHYS
jgi:ATP-binding cassette subfamily D (ALD) long-chain fatty acid import protein